MYRPSEGSNGCCQIRLERHDCTVPKHHAGSLRSVRACMQVRATRCGRSNPTPPPSRQAQDLSIDGIFQSHDGAFQSLAEIVVASQFRSRHRPRPAMLDSCSRPRAYRVLGPASTSSLGNTPDLWGNVTEANEQSAAPWLLMTASDAYKNCARSRSAGDRSRFLYNFW